MLTHRVEPGHKVHLGDIDPGDTRGVERADAEARLSALNAELTDLQEVHYAAGHNAILIVLQGLDTAGKDGTIKHVMAQFNPAGCRVETFKVPTPEEQAHDFLWRCHRVTPAQGTITIFNRSHYEDVLVVRVHKLAPKATWEKRYAHINNFEHLLVDSGTIVLKFFLYISRDEQRRRLIAREQDTDKAWKLSVSDWSEHALYEQYIEAYEDALSRCSTEHAPWYIVPADHKWLRNLAVAQTIVDVMDPYRRVWREELEQLGRERLAAAKAAGRA
ncbi:MAG TPA: PPK2 family polyphosphate kinase [Chloroflexota bacterium]|nr:PPK2 family polyphosphate kinase [Chloroflexota bacterium]